MHEVGTYIVAVLTLGVASQWLAWRINIPSIVLLAIVGLLVGPVTLSVNPGEVFGDTLRPVIGLCVAIILFEGGLSLNVRDLRHSGTGIRGLIVRGVPLNWALAAAAGHWVGGLSWPVAVVFGAIMIVTGPTVILPMLRQAGLNRRTASYLKWEGIVNDPVGVLLAVLSLQLFVHAGDEGWLWLASSVGLSALALGIGAAAGFGMGRAFRGGGVPEYLKAPVMLMIVFVVFQVGDWLHEEAGLLGVTAMGVVVGNMRLASIEDMRRFKEYITVILVGIVFILLTADISRDTLLAADWRVLWLVLAIVFVTRPVATMLATIGTGMKFTDRLFLAWIAPRGIVAAATAGVMGPSLVEAGYAGAESLLALVFGVIFATVVLHGSTVGVLARRLGLVSSEVGSLLIVGASPWTIALAQRLTELGVRVVMADTSWRALAHARMEGLQVYYGEILSETVADSLEIAHVDTVLAATANDMYNALVCTAMAPAIGRSSVFQLPMERLEEDPRQVARPLRGRVAFGAEADYDRLWRLHARGWRFETVEFGEDTDYAHFLESLPEGAVQILARHADGVLDVRRGGDDDAELEAGDVLVYFAPPRDDAEASAVDPGHHPGSVHQPDGPSPGETAAPAGAGDHPRN